MRDVTDGTSDPMDRNPLHYAALNDDVAAARRVIASGADVNAPDRSGMTALHFAAQAGSLQVARLLLESGARVDDQDRNGNTALFTAVFNSRGEGPMIQLLRHHGADPAKPNRHGQTPLALARLIDDHPIARWFSDLPDSE
jgi:ankyrin repeat protein